MDEYDDRLPLLRRGVFDSDLADYVGHSREAAPLVLVMVDIDKFKMVNDSYGHPVGDELLVEVAQCTNGIVGTKGRVYRYGGEEIAILLPNYSSEEAVALAERIRRTLEASSWTSKRLKVTASFGVAAVPTLASNGSDLLRLADAALYQAKQVGRNYVRLAGEPLPPEPQPRQPERREPPPGGLSESEMESLRLEYYKHGRALCPKDGLRLRVQEGGSFGVQSPPLHMECPVCAFKVEIPAIPVAKEHR